MIGIELPLYLFTEVHNVCTFYFRLYSKLKLVNSTH